MSHTATVGFFGAVDAVTGNNFYFGASGKKIMVDCGLYQGDSFADERNHAPFMMDPKEIDVLLVTHAHIDHIGRIPKFVKEGFRGRIISTVPTKQLAEIMLYDTVRILAKEATKQGVLPVYEEKDVDAVFRLWHTEEYYHKFHLADHLDCEIKDAGHMLGSSMYFLTLGSETMVFTGDLGNSPTPLLRDTDSIAGAKYMLMEAVYGDRNHEDRDTRKERLAQAIRDSIAQGGTLLMPAFSIERTQEFLYELNDLVEHHKIPDVKIFVDSPLAIKATRVYHESTKYFGDLAKSIIKSGDDVFRFPNLYFTESKDESMHIWDTPGPKVIMAGSGMLNGGRIMHHFKHYAGNPKTHLMMTGYQAAGTIGRRLIEGDREIEVDGAVVKVHAKVSSLNGYSGHKDLDHLVEFVENGRDTLKKVFVAIGEPKSTMFLAQRLRDYLGVDAVVPELGQTVELEFND